MKWLATIVRVLFLVLFVFLIVRGKVFLWFALFVISLIVAVVFGRIYCGYVCPMNTLMIPATWLSKKLKIQTDQTPEWLQKKSIAWIALFMSLAVMLLAKSIFQLNVPVLPFWLVISVLVTLRFQPDVFHNLICPFGPLQKWFGQWTRFSKKVNPDECIGCRLCEKVCPSRAIIVKSENRKAVINQTLCHQCTHCQEICPENAIRYQALN